jgi:hypothetical protein
VERPDPLALDAQHHVHAAGQGGQRGSTVGVVGVAVGQRDPLDRPVARGHDPLEVIAVVRARVHDPAPDHVGVGPVQRQGRRVAGADAAHSGRIGVGHAGILA